MSYPPKTVAWETFEEATRSLAAEVCKREALEAAHAGAMALHEADAKQWLEQKASLEAQLAEARRRIEEEEGNYVSALERGDNAIRQLAERTRDRDENSRQCADEYSARRKAEAEVQRLQGELEDRVVGDLGLDGGSAGHATVVSSLGEAIDFYAAGSLELPRSESGHQYLPATIGQTFQSPGFELDPD